MKMIGGLIAFGLLIAAAPAPAQNPAPAAPAEQLDPRNLALASEIIEISYPPETRAAMLSRTTDAMLAQGRAAAIRAMGDRLDDDTRQILDRYLSRVRERSEAFTADGSPAIFEAFARAYARQFSYDELVQIRAFVATPAGAKFVQQADDLLSDPDVARANTAYMTEAFTALQPLQAQLFDELRAHFERRSRQAR